MIQYSFFSLVSNPGQVNCFQFFPIGIKDRDLASEDLGANSASIQKGHVITVNLIVLYASLRDRGA